MVCWEKANHDRRCDVKRIKKFFCAIIAALDAVVSLDKYVDILQGYWDEGCPDEHEKCWQ